MIETSEKAASGLEQGEVNAVIPDEDVSKDGVTGPKAQVQDMDLLLTSDTEPSDGITSLEKYTQLTREIYIYICIM